MERQSGLLAMGSLLCLHYDLFETCGKLTYLIPEDQTYPSGLCRVTTAIITAVSIARQALFAFLQPLMQCDIHQRIM